VLTLTRGYAAPEVGNVYRRARQLAQQIQEPAQRFPVLFGLWQFHILRAELYTAAELAEQLLRLAQAQGDPTLLLQAHRALGFTLLYRGEVGCAQQHAEQGFTLYDAARHRQQAFLAGQDPGITCLVYIAQALWLRGHPAPALRQITTALTMARELQHPYSLAVALGWAAWLHQHRREWWLVQERAEAVVALATAHGFALWAAQGTVLRGWALAMQGQGAAGIARIRQGLTALEGTGTMLMRPYFLALLAEAYGKAGQVAAGRAALAEAQAVAQQSGERFYESELHRLEGELRLADAAGKPPDAAEACFHRAMVCARSQQALSLELRTAVSLGRLWQQQGKSDAAAQLLAELCNRCGAGGDTVDLQEARALLAALR
jgi:predicted ATPase